MPCYGDSRVAHGGCGYEMSPCAVLCSTIELRPIPRAELRERQYAVIVTYLSYGRFEELVHPVPKYKRTRRR